MDTHLCKKDEFAWVVSHINVCQQLFKLFEKLVAATILWKLHLVSFVGFSDTRFANSRRKVYTNIQHEFPAIRPAWKLISLMQLQMQILELGERVIKQMNLRGKRPKKGGIPLAVKSRRQEDAH